MIYTKKQAGSEMAEMALGGIRIYGEQEEMRASIAAVMDAIDAAFEGHLCMTKPGFKKSICSKIVSENPERVFSGVFGRMISEGRIQIAECRAETGSIYRSYFRTLDRHALEAALSAALDEIGKSAKCQISAVEKRLFGGRAWGTWSKTAIVVGILARPGIVRFLSRFEVAITPGARHAANTLQLHKFNSFGGMLAARSSLPG